MGDPFRRIGTDADWSALKAEARGKREIVLFKRSPICPVSAAVEETFDAWAAQVDPAMGPVLTKVDVVNARPLARAIAAELSVKHESPQAIWLAADGSVRWHASHHDIRPEALDRMLRRG